MEVKKSTKANLEKSKSLSILMGLIVALSVVFVSFEWGTKDIEIAAAYHGWEPDVPELIDITRPEDPTPPPPPPPQKPMDDFEIVDDKDIVDDLPDFSSEDNQKNAQQELIPDSNTDIEDEEPADIDFIVVEKMPVFPGGDQELLRFIQRNVKYPVPAQEANIQGRVICSFIISQDGSVINAEVVRGIDPSLDREALRVIGQMPKWQPGKQRGKPVRVKYTLPITFRLN